MAQLDISITLQEDHHLPIYLNEKYRHLQQILRSMRSVLVAYSGGVDSAVLLKVAHDVLGDRCLGVLAVSPAYDAMETRDALAVAETMGIPVETVQTQELENPAYTANAPDRCYFCKEELFSHLFPIARQHHIEQVVYGMNASDRGDYRPGQRSALERGVRGPLMEVGMVKEDIRKLAKYLQVPVWNKPAMACYSSRIPYGIPVSIEALQRIGKAERLIRSLGFKRVRVRHHDTIARIEVDAADIERIIDPAIRMLIDTQLREFGYQYVTLDIRGYRTGSMNEVLGRKTHQPY